MEKYRDNFWYISLNSERISNRKIISVQTKKNYSILELSTEADPDIIDRCKLIFFGRGIFSDPAIQKELTIHVNRILKNRK